MILILDKQRDIKTWLQSAPIKDLELFDVSGKYSLNLFEHADLIIIADYQEKEFRVMKDRKVELYVTKHISQLGQYLTNWVAMEVLDQHIELEDDIEGQPV